MKNLLLLTGILISINLSAQQACQYENLRTNSEGIYTEKITSPVRIYTAMTTYNVSSIKLSLCKKNSAYSLRMWFNSNKKVSFPAGQRLILTTSDGKQYMLKLIPQKSTSDKWGVLMMQYTNYYAISAADLRKLSGKELTGFTIPNSGGIFNVDLVQLNPFKSVAGNYFAENVNCVLK